MLEGSESNSAKGGERKGENEEINVYLIYSLGQLPGGGGAGNTRRGGLRKVDQKSNSPVSLEGNGRTIYKTQGVEKHHQFRAMRLWK